jgi:predicted phage-related endonuclease
MKIHDLQQGTDAWHQFRLDHFGASEAAAMLGLSKQVRRTELLHMKHTGIAREFSDWVEQHILARGHEVEAMARPHVEALIGDDLYPVTCSDGKLSASCDGLTLGQELAFEHKQYAEALFSSVKNAHVPEEHMPQCQQVLMVTGAKKLLFVVSDGTPERMATVEVMPDPAWFERLRAGWAQFERDLANYVPAEVTEAAPAGRAPETLLPSASKSPAPSLRRTSPSSRRPR